MLKQYPYANFATDVLDNMIDAVFTVDTQMSITAYNMALQRFNLS